MDGRGKHPNSQKNLALGRGRPRPCYAVSHALAAVAEEPETIDNSGNVITKAQLAAKWLWDKAFDNDLPFQHRLEALKTILNRIEPDFKLTDKNVACGDEDDSAIDLSRLTEDDLRRVESTLAKAMPK